ncbi:MAG TPA: DNA replication/repair protein RecF [Candidatus Saccharimonadales bacterium]
MIITGVGLNNFRSYKEQVFELEAGVNIVVGPNASGKTNLLESIYLGCQGKSFRGTTDKLIQHKKPWSRVELTTDKGSRVIKLRRDQPPKKEFVLDGLTKRRLTLDDKIPVVLFTPDDLRLVNGSPERRRRFLDDLVSKLEPEATSVLSQYQRALLQRNNLLKYPNPDPDELFVWAVRLSELGGKIVEWRLQLIQKLNQKAGKIYSLIAGAKQTVKFSYDSNLSPPKSYQTKLSSHLQGQRDIHLGFTSCGPHRDDLRIELGNSLSSDSSSRGEVRSLVLVSKLIEIQLLESRSGQKPILLFDDVFSELDGARRRRLSEQVLEHQTIITTTDADAVVAHFLKRANVIPITYYSK